MKKPYYEKVRDQFQITNPSHTDGSQKVFYQNTKFEDSKCSSDALKNKKMLSSRKFKLDAYFKMATKIFFNSYIINRHFHLCILK
jgi:hypothetical protein